MSNSINPNEVTQVIDFLRESAANILGSALGNDKLSAFYAGSQGGFPYHTVDANHVDRFNANTYNWIKTNLKPGSGPNFTPNTGDSFTNEFQRVITNVTYKLSSDDMDKLNKARHAASDQSVSFRELWLNKYGKYPPSKDGGFSTETDMDRCVDYIRNNWGPSGTVVSLTELFDSPDLSQTLPNTPVSGQGLLVYLAGWLSAISPAKSLINDLFLNTGFLNKVKKNIMAPTSKTGGIQLSNGSDNYYPNYKVSPSYQGIVNGLNSKNTVSMSASISRSSESEYKVSISGGGGFTLPIEDWFTINIGGSSSYFSDKIATSSNSIDMTFTYPGVSVVHWGPMPYDNTGLDGNGWYAIQPVLDAIKNKGKDVSGFQFAASIDMDWSENGPFSFMSGAVISRFPTVDITVKSSDYNSIAEKFQNNVHVGLTFLGIPLGAQGNASTYSSSVHTDSSSETVKITLTPPDETVGVMENDLKSWVMGAFVEYPCKDA